LFPGAITAYNGAQHFRSHLPDIHDELVPKALKTRKKNGTILFTDQLFSSANAIFNIYECQFITTGLILMKS
jgi:hypothetical protein